MFLLPILHNNFSFQPILDQKVFGLKLEYLAKIGWKKCKVLWFFSRGYGIGFFWECRWKYMTIACKPHILFLWWVFLRLGSTSSCGVIFMCFLFLSQSGKIDSFSILVLKLLHKRSNGRLSKIRSVHTYVVVTRTVYCK